MMASTVQETAHASLSFGGMDTEKKMRHGEQEKNRPSVQGPPAAQGEKTLPESRKIHPAPKQNQMI